MTRFNIFLIGLLLGACTNAAPDAGNAGDSGQSKDRNDAAQELCFRLLEGSANQDTTSLKLILDGDSFKGDMAHYPSEKDSRVGSVKGRIEGELITGTWTFMQEGMTDSLPVEFRFSDDKLVQKSYTVNEQTGRQELTGASKFDREFVKVNCGQ